MTSENCCPTKPEITRVTTTLDFRDRLGSWKARWGINRMNFTVRPGLYAVGNPDAESVVLVTANYKMSFDALRSQLGGMNAWIMVLDTRGINVWCAAGKGTFSAEEIVKRIAEVRLAEVVTHRKLILPQLGAPGVDAYQVKKESGWRVIYGPVRASDLPAFLKNGMKATPLMRKVTFSLSDRLVLIPLELVYWSKYGLIAMAVLFLLAGIGSGGYSVSRMLSLGIYSSLLFLCAYLAGTVVTPALLPWLPGRAFAAKGAVAGLLFLPFANRYLTYSNQISYLAWFLIIPAVASFLGMNFTGASTYASPSGVKREMRIFVPLQAAGVVVGLCLWLAGRFI